MSSIPFVDGATTVPSQDATMGHDTVAVDDGARDQGIVVDSNTPNTDAGVSVPDAAKDESGPVDVNVAQTDATARVDGGAPDRDQPDVSSSSDARAMMDANTGMGGAPADSGSVLSGYQPLVSTKFDEIKLFDGDPPNLKKGGTPESIGDGGRIYDVSVPTLRRYPVDISKSTGIAFIVFPGGGYSHLDIERHATALATRMGPQGVAVFGLKYRCGDGTDNVRRDALLDANRAVRLVRAHAAAWGVVPERMGIVSYSAGSHLAMNLAGHFDAGQPNSSDPVEKLSSRPAYFASMCTWDSGNSTSKFTFLASTPPVYMCHAKDDTTAPIALAQAIEKQLQALNVLEHLETYATGGHDSFNVGETAEGHNWPDKFMTWLRTNALVP